MIEGQTMWDYGWMMGHGWWGGWFMPFGGFWLLILLVILFAVLLIRFPRHHGPPPPSRSLSASRPRSRLTPPRRQPSTQPMPSAPSVGTPSSLA